MKTLAVIMMAMPMAACTPRIEVAAPKEPITINMNVKIQHDINIKADKEVETLLEQQEIKARE